MRHELKQRTTIALCLILSAAGLAACSDAPPGSEGTSGTANATGGTGSTGGGASSTAGMAGTPAAGSAQGGTSQASAGTGGSAAGSSPAAGAGGSSGAGGSASGGASGAGGGAAGDTWENYGKGFMTTYCVSCHNDDNQGSATRDYHMLQAVKAESEDIACGLAKSQEVWSARGCTGGPAAMQFPAGGGAKPDDAERDRILAWIDAGMP